MGQMETNRLKLQTLLEQMMVDSNLPKNVYFQPPENLKMSYPCIVYHRQYIDGVPADNINYLINRQYRVIYIDRSPVNDLVIDKLMEMPNCRYMSHSIVDNLNQDAFEIYF